MTPLSFLVIFALMAALAHGAPFPPEQAILKAASKCREGTAITQESVNAVLKNNAEPDEKTKCYFKCFFQDLGMMDSDGAIILDAPHSHFMDCSKKVADVMDHCDKAYKFDVCIHQQFPDMPTA